MTQPETQQTDRSYDADLGADANFAPSLRGFFEDTIPAGYAACAEATEAKRDLLTLHAAMSRGCGMGTPPPEVLVGGPQSSYFPFFHRVLLAQPDFRDGDAYSEELTHAIRHAAAGAQWLARPEGKAVSEFFGFLGRTFARELGAPEMLPHLNWRARPMGVPEDDESRRPILEEIRRSNAELEEIVSGHERALVFKTSALRRELEGLVPIDRTAALRQGLSDLAEAAFRQAEHLERCGLSVGRSLIGLGKAFNLSGRLLEQFPDQPAYEELALKSVEIAEQLAALAPLAIRMDAYHLSPHFRPLHDAGHVIGYPAAKRALSSGRKAGEIIREWIGASDEQVYLTWIA